MQRRTPYLRDDARKTRRVPMSEVYPAEAKNFSLAPGGDVLGLPTFPKEGSRAFWNPVFERLNNTTIGDVLPMDRPVVSVTPDASVNDALALLSSHCIHALPVIDENSAYHGVVTVTQLMRYVYFENYSAAQRKEESAFGYKQPGPVAAGVSLAALDGKTVSDVADMPYSAVDSPRQPLRCLNLEDSMGKAARLLLKGHYDIPLRSSHNGKIVGMISNKDVLRFLGKHKTAKSDRVYQLIENLAFDPSDYPDAVTCDTSASVYDGLRTLFKSGHSSLALTDPATGAIKGVFSASDLARVATEHKQVDLTGLSLQTFLATYHPASLNPVITFENAYVNELVDLGTEENVSTLFSVGFKQRPKQVVSSVDVLRVLKGIHIPRPSAPMDPWHRESASYATLNLGPTAMKKKKTPITKGGKGHGSLLPSQAEHLAEGEYLKHQTSDQYNVYTRLPSETCDVDVRRDDSTHTLHVSIDAGTQATNRELPIPSSFRVFGQNQGHTSAHIVHQGQHKLLHILLESSNKHRFAPPCMPHDQGSHMAPGVRVINISTE